MEPPFKRHAGRAAAGTLVAVVMAAFALGTLCAGCGDRAHLPVPAGDPGSPPPLVSGLSLDQGKMVDELGYPDHFFISMDPDTADRMETWIYFAAGRSLDFCNGRLYGESETEDESSTYPPTDLKPQDFDATTSPEDAVRLLGEPLFSQEARNSLMPENTIIVYEGAVLLYRDGRLIGVDTKVRPPGLPVTPSGPGW